MQHGIREFRPRQPLDRQLSSDTLNRILRELESLRITRVVNGTFKKLPGGTEIVVAPQSRGGGTPATPQPWDLIVRVDPDSDQEQPDHIVSVRPGTLNGILPSNWQIEETIPSGSPTQFAKAVVSVNGDNISQVEIVIDENEPEIQEAQLFGIESSVEFLFGTVTNGQATRVTGDGNISVVPRTWLIVDSDPPAAPGESPYHIYYNLLEL